ncbi:MAG: P-loop NTPase, partial [Phycisphaeraceae bacterium]|nr:P-loop NTPase [Phycisphaeraceae bacterium]
MTDQASALRSMVRQESSLRRGRFVAVTSGKGGVGKTSVALNLSVCLSNMGRRVVLLDADLGTANVDVLCNLTPHANLAHVIAGRKTLAEATIEGPGGFQLIPGASGLASLAALSSFERQRLIDQMQHLDHFMMHRQAGVGGKNHRRGGRHGDQDDHRQGHELAGSS